MALFGNSGGLISGVLNTFGSSIGGNLGSVLGFGSQVIGNIVASSGPAAAPVLAAAAPMAPAMAAKPIISAARSAVGAITTGARKMLTGAAASGLIKIAQATGRSTMSLRSAVKLIRKMGKFLEPAAIAAALGLTAQELAEIIVADSQRTRRRMNPANVHALRRSMRRITSFHRLAQRVDLLKTRRSGPRRKACGPGGSIVQVR